MSKGEAREFREHTAADGIFTKSNIKVTNTIGGTMRSDRRFIFSMLWLLLVTFSLLACSGGGGGVVDAKSGGVKLNIVWPGAAAGTLSMPANVYSVMLKIKGDDMATMLQSLPVNETSVTLTVPDGANRTFIVWTYPAAMSTTVNYYGSTTSSVSGNTTVTILMSTDVPQPSLESDDTQSPTMTTGLGAVAASKTQVDLSWNAATDNLGVSGYRVFRNGNLVASAVTATSYSDTGLVGDTTYDYQVAAYDAVGNLSAWSDPPFSVVTPVFDQTDITGTWKFNILSTGPPPTAPPPTGPTNGWMRGTGTADSSGFLTVSSFEDNEGNTALPDPNTIQWTITGCGVLSESGANGDDNVHMTMTSNKNFIAGTSGAGRYTLRIAQKVVPGTTYSNADVRGKSFSFHQLSLGGMYSEWSHGEGVVLASGQINIVHDYRASIVGDNPHDNEGTISVDASGTVAIDTISSFRGFLSADKQTIVGVLTDTDASIVMVIIQVSGQTYAAGDLVGTYSNHMLFGGAATGWIHETDTVAEGGVVTVSSEVNSFGGTMTQPAKTASINSSGTITVTEDPSFHGTASYDKKFVVATHTNGPGIFSLSVMTR